MSDLTKETWKYTWDYKKDGAFYHPMLSVSLIPNVLDGVTISCDALVDTGADWCIFPESFLEQLGIKQDDLPHTEVSLVSGSPVLVHLDIVTLDFGFTKYETLVGFHGNNFAMLGHKGFFDRFVVVFDTANKQFMVTNQKP